MEIQSTFRNCENNQQLYDCLQDALETPFFLAHIDNVKAAIEVDERSGTQVIKCTLSLVVQNNGVIACSASSDCSQVAINVAAKRGEQMLRRILRRDPLGVSHTTSSLTNTLSSMMSRDT